MDWISFFWGVGAIIFVNIVYAVWFYPKTVKQLAETEKQIAELENKYESFMLEHEEKLVSLEKQRDKVKSALERLEEIRNNERLEFDKLIASVKLRKSCPACGHEFPLYIVEEKVK